MRLTFRDIALLALPTLSSAVSLSDMTPRAQGLPDTCEKVYTSQIYGCSSDDLSTQQCSPSCISALFGVSTAISRACSGQGVTGQNLVVAFLAGVGPQQLCHNIGKGRPHGPPPMSPPMSPDGPPPAKPTHSTHVSPTIVESTTTAQKPTQLTSLLVDTSSTMTQTEIAQPTENSSSSVPTSSSTKAKTTAAPEKTTHKARPSPSPTTSGSSTTTTASSAAAESSEAEEEDDDHSGGGSPFDSEGNMMGAASGISVPMASTLLSAMLALAILR